MSFYATPSQQRHLRACMVCAVVQPHTKFVREGCPNCENVLQLAGNTDAIEECTSQVFEGLMSIGNPTVSWVARWQRLDNYVAGTYAAKVTGILPEYIISSLEDSGIKFVP
ncbi:Transcription elongation factor spt4 [Penicillium diatomitis]|nr:Transcription elongation factor spt4 [Penicillium diatomitis]KAJ5495432.1 Transcription elongation factor spt4 [Penicillium diatomitis]